MKKFNKTIQGFHNNKIDVQLFTDGSCYPNPGHFGGYAAIAKFNQRLAVGLDFKRSGSIGTLTTNNRMELTAVIVGLQELNHAVDSNPCLPSPLRVEIITDSEYVGKGIAMWMDNWRKHGFKNKNGDLWKQLDDLLTAYDINVTCILGHNGQKENEECDRMAGEERLKLYNMNKIKNG